MQKTADFTKGPILGPLLRFAMPVLGALLLQAMYGAVDLAVVGQFAAAEDVSAVATGSMLMQSITVVITGLSMGTTILLGQRLGEGRKDQAGDVIGGAIWLFAVIGAATMVLGVLLARPLCATMQAPQDAFAQTVQYVAICSAGALFIVAYNVLGSVFRGLGDANTPLLAVIVACITNIMGDLFFVAVLHWASAGAAAATVLAQAVSVVLCFLVIRRRGLPFDFHRGNIRPHKKILRKTVQLGAPLALQDLLVSISFLVIMAIVNSLGVVPSAGVGVAEKLCAFIMLVPSAFSQALSAFVAQNAGAGRDDRAHKAMFYGMGASLTIGIVIGYLAFFHGDILCGLFASDAEVIAAGADYLRAYAIDTLLTAFLFCFNGYFNGCGRTQFVMWQGIAGAFLVRIPVSWFMRGMEPTSLFRIGLATPCSTVVQIVLCTLYYRHMHRRVD